MTSQNWAKHFEIFIYVSKIVPWDSQANKLNLAKMTYGGSHMQIRAP